MHSQLCSGLAGCLTGVGSWAVALVTKSWRPRCVRSWSSINCKLHHDINAHQTLRLALGGGRELAIGCSGLPQYNSPIAIASPATRHAPQAVTAGASPSNDSALVLDIMNRADAGQGVPHLAGAAGGRGGEFPFAGQPLHPP